jgi:hypothetical protein
LRKKARFPVDFDTFSLFLASGSVTEGLEPFVRGRLLGVLTETDPAADIIRLGYERGTVQQIKKMFLIYAMRVSAAEPSLPWRSWLVFSQIIGKIKIKNWFSKMKISNFFFFLSPKIDMYKRGKWGFQKAFDTRGIFFSLDGRTVRVLFLSSKHPVKSSHFPFI